MTRNNEKNLGFEKLLRQVCRETPESLPPRQLQAAPDTCSSLTRIRRGVLRQDFSADELAHLVRCRRCSWAFRSLQEELWHPSPAELALYSYGRGRGMLSSVASQLLEKLAGPHASAVYRHVEEDLCKDCTAAVEAYSSLGMLRTWLRPLAEEPAKYLERFRHTFDSLTCSLAPLQVPASLGSLSAMSFCGPTEPQSIPFDHEHLSVWTYFDRKNHWLRIEHTDCPPDALFRIEITNPDPSSESSCSFERFVYMQSGLRGRRGPTKGELPLGVKHPGGRIVVLPVQLADLMPTDAEVLQDSCAAECLVDPSARTVWAAWADRALAQSVNLHPAIREVLQTIQGSGETKSSSPAGFAGCQSPVCSGSPIPEVASHTADLEVLHRPEDRQIETWEATRDVA